ncbi:MAG: ComF family protein [Candidatus Syntrophosphaera sp.]|nr:ComF family protein [Candidatus Syntrophosphaera sp.]
MQLSKDILAQADKLFFPPNCLACGSRTDSAEEALCANCRDLLLPIRETYCGKCGGPLRDYGCEACSQTDFCFDFARSAYVYQRPAQELVHGLKYGFLRSPAKFFTDALLEIPALARFGEGFDLVMAVPLHHVRQRERGYNQSELIARKLALKLGLPYARPVCRRYNTRSQTNLSREARLGNLSGAFALEGKADVKGKRVILVDDVFTTGTTANEVSRLLRDSGAAKIAVLTATRAV